MHDRDLVAVSDLRKFALIDPNLIMHFSRNQLNAALDARVLCDTETPCIACYGSARQRPCLVGDSHRRVPRSVQKPEPITLPNPL